MNRIKRPLISPLLIGVMAILTLGCGTATTTTTSSYSDIMIETANGHKFTINDVEFVIEGPLKFEHKYDSVSGATTTVYTAVAGVPLLMVGEMLHVGPKTFDHVHKKDKVTLSASGISVNGKRRGDFPSQAGPSK